MQIIALLLSGLLVGPLQKSVDVCELLRNIETYNGQIVTVRAFVGGGSRHGYYLMDNKHETGCASLPKSKTSWPPTIDLTWPGGPELGGFVVPFELDVAGRAVLRIHSFVSRRQ